MSIDMNQQAVIWLASYPRSGNTFLRTMLNHCFGLKSASVYPADLGGNQALENYVGHIEVHPPVSNALSDAALPLVKTHEAVKDNAPAIYVIRDGRAACASLWQFYKGSISMDAIIDGQHRFGLWSEHVMAWNPWQRPDTLMIEYDDMVHNRKQVLENIAGFLDRDIISETLPDRNIIAGVDGQWVKKKKSWRSILQGQQLQRFNRLNKDVLKAAGYI